jgi:L-cystine uptake protein TcyP (sodium:dicarboxylate symporter family)
MTANGWLALIIMVVINGILVWTLFVEHEETSRRAQKWFFIVGNGFGLILAVSQFFWMDF